MDRVPVGLLHQLAPLHHPETMLLIDDYEPDLGELHGFFEQRMRADDQLSVALGNVTADFVLAVLLERAGQQYDPIPRVFQNSSSGEVMLLREDFRGRHQCGLVPILNRNDGSLERDNRLPGPDVALQQTPHGIRLLHVASDLFQNALLRAGRVEGQNLLDGGTNPVVQTERDTRLRFHLPALEFEAELDEEKLFKDQAQMS